MNNATTHPLLRPQPMTPAQVADLVERARAAEAAKRIEMRRLGLESLYTARAVLAAKVAARRARMVRR